MRRKTDVSNTFESDMRSRRVTSEGLGPDDDVRGSVNPAYGGASLGDVARVLMRPKNAAARETLERLQASDG